MKKMIIALLGLTIFTSCKKEIDEPQNNLELIRYTVTPKQWQTFGTPGSGNHGLTYQLEVDELSSGILTSSLIMVYLVEDISSLEPLPLTTFLNGENIQQKFVASRGAIDLYLTAPNSQELSIENDFDYQVVIAPAAWAKQAVTNEVELMDVFPVLE